MLIDVEALAILHEDASNYLIKGHLVTNYDHLALPLSSFNHILLATRQELLHAPHHIRVIFHELMLVYEIHHGYAQLLSIFRGKTFTFLTK